MKDIKAIAYEKIKEKIITCQFLPGAIMTEIEIQESVNIGRTSIRQALSKLEQENLVKILSKKGIQITSISIKDVEYIYTTREMLEPLAARLAAEYIDTDLLIPFYNGFIAHAQMDSIDNYLSFDREFHYLLNTSSNNQYLCRILMNVYDLNTRIRVLSKKRISDRYNEARIEHLELIDALNKRDGALAASIMKKHIANGKETALKILD